MCSHSPRVSIGLPVYNGERFLKDAVESILAQSFEDFELIISDNASTDGTEKICRTYAARDERIRYYRNQTNLGAAKNYNRVFEFSSGEYFKWLAADDVCAPEFLARCVELLDRDPTAVLAYPKPIRIDEQGNVLRNYYRVIQPKVWRPRTVDRFRQLIDELTLDSRYAPMYVFGLFRSRALRQTRLIGNYPYPDPIVLAEIILIGQFCEVPEYLSYLRSHPESLSSTFTQGTKKTQEFFDPAVRGRIPQLLYRWRHYFELFVSILRSRLGPRERSVLLYYSLGPPLRQLGKKLRRRGVPR